MNPFSGFVMLSLRMGDEGGRSLRRLLLGVWPVAMITKSVGSSVPLVSWTLKGVLLVSGKPLGGIIMRDPVTSLFISQCHMLFLSLFP